jgi:hypothetical protein
VQWTYDKGVPNRSSILLVGDHLLMMNSMGVATCLRAKDGKEQAEKLRLPSGKRQFWASPIASEGKWYAFDDEGEGLVISADEKMTVLATNKLADGCRASPAAVGRALYVRTMTHLYRIEAAK